MYEPNNLMHRRQQAAALLEAVLDERLAPAVALNRWPDDSGSGQDVSLDVAYQALWYFEADEDRQRTQVFYLDAQLELLRQMAGVLGKGRPLPDYMQQEYSPDWFARYYYPSNPLTDIFRWARRVFAIFWRTWRSAVSLLQQ